MQANNNVDLIWPYIPFKLALPAEWQRGEGLIFLQLRLLHEAARAPKKAGDFHKAKTKGALQVDIR